MNEPSTSVDLTTNGSGSDVGDMEIESMENDLPPPRKKTKIEKQNERAAIAKKIKDRVYHLQPKPEKERKKSAAWEYMHNILDENSTILRLHVACSKCFDVFDYQSRTLGTRSLLDHRNKCTKSDPVENIATNQSNLNRFYSGVTAPVKITNDAKRQMSEAALRLIGKDLRPFNAIEGEGMKQFLQHFSGFCRNGQPLSEEDITNILPSRFTVSFPFPIFLNKTFMFHFFISIIVESLDNENRKKNAG